MTTIIIWCLSLNLRIKKYKMFLLNMFYRVGTFKIEYINVIFLNFQKEKSDLCQIRVSDKKKPLIYILI